MNNNMFEKDILEYKMKNTIVYLFRRSIFEKNFDILFSTELLDCVMIDKNNMLLLKTKLKGNYLINLNMVLKKSELKNLLKGLHFGIMHDWCEGYLKYNRKNRTYLKTSFDSETLNSFITIDNLSIPIEIYVNNDETLFNAFIFKEWVMLPSKDRLISCDNWLYVDRLKNTIKYLLVVLFDKDGVKTFLKSPLIEKVFYVLTTNELMIVTQHGYNFLISKKILSNYHKLVKEKLADNYVISINSLISDLCEFKPIIPNFYKNDEIIELSEIESVYDFNDIEYRIPEPGSVIEMYLPSLYEGQKENDFI